MYPVYVPRPVPPEPLYYTEGRIQHEHSHVDISPVFMPGYYMINITFCIHSYVCVIPYPQRTLGKYWGTDIRPELTDLFSG